MGRRKQAQVTATRVDPETQIAERVQFVPTPGGQIYTWTAEPPDARAAVVVCSSISADFTANYHRERLLSMALAQRGLAVVRFHYRGLGNSDGEGADMTFESICDDAAAIVDHVGATLAPQRLAFHGTRMGALVAATCARPLGAPLSLWEPVVEPKRFFREAFRFKRINVLAGTDENLTTWQAELEPNGVVDLVGYDAHQPLVDSLQRQSLTAILGDDPPQMLVVGFSEKASTSRMAAGWDGKLYSTTLSLPESWWFHNEQVHEATELVDVTTSWLVDELTAHADGQEAPR